jgi:AbrB family looped-hinge helix DNA binding protein
MRATATLDKAGRLVLPKALREALDLAPGDILDLTMENEQVTLRPRRSVPPLQKERGVWVYRTGEPLSASETREIVRSIRERRGRPARGVSG